MDGEESAEIVTSVFLAWISGGWVVAGEDGEAFSVGGFESSD